VQPCALSGREGEGEGDTIMFDLVIDSMIVDWIWLLPVSVLYNGFVLLVLMEDSKEKHSVVELAILMLFPTGFLMTLYFLALLPFLGFFWLLDNFKIDVWRVNK